MCGRFALGLPPAEIRQGVADHFPRLLRNPEARAARARHGEEARQRQRQDRQRRRERASAATIRRRNDTQHEQQQRHEAPQVDQDEELEWPPSDQEDLTGNNPESETSVAPSVAAQLRWENEERFRTGNYNVSPRSNGVVLRLRPRSQSQAEPRQGNIEEGTGSELRLRGGGEEGEAVSAVSKQEELAVVNNNELDVGDQELVIETMQWGLIPHWSKHPPSGALNTINARSEALIDNAGGMWQSLKGPKRCLVVVQGYYEWQKKSGTKIPHFTKLPSTTPESPHLMLLAGLYDTVRYVDSDPSSPPIKTFTILTTTPSKSLGWLHDRMPCVLESEEDCVKWLDCRNGWTGEVARLLRPYEGEVECYPVPTEVGKVGTNSPSFVVPVKERKDGIANFFKKQTSADGGTSAHAAVTGKPLKTEHQQEDLKREKEKGKRSRKEDEDDDGRPVDDSRSGKKIKMDVETIEEKVHAPVPSNTIKVRSPDERKTDTKPALPDTDEKPSNKKQTEEKEFELQIGDDSNAPNPTGGSERNTQEIHMARGDAKPTTGSKRQTRSSARSTELNEKRTTRSTRSGKQSISTKKEKKDSDDEIQILSSPDTVPSKSRKSGTTSASTGPGKRTSVPERQTSKKGGKQVKSVVQATTDDGAENTHQTKLDGFLKHED